MTEFRKPRPSDKMDDHAEQHSHAFDEISNLKGSIEHNKGYIEHNEDRINALEHELDAVAETKSTGEWQLVSPLDFDIRGTGKMTLSNNDLTAPNNELTLHATDLNNVSHGFSGVEVGDLVEVLEEHEVLSRSTGDYGLYEVKAVNGMTFTLELQQGRGVADTNSKFFIKFFHLSDDVNISELDERYSLKSHTHSYVKSNADTAITPAADNRFVSFKNKRPQEEDGSYADKEFGLEVNIDEGNTYKNQFQVSNRHGYALKIMGGGGRTTWFGGKITQKGDSLENADDRDYIIRKNLTDAISELSDEYASEGHNHEEYFPFGDWSDSEFEPHADLRAWDDAWMEMFNFYDKAQKITDRIQDTRLDALEEQNVSLLSKIEELEGRIEELEPDYGIALGTFTLKVDNGRPTGASQTIGVAGIWHSKVADATTSPNNEMKANNGSSALINQITSHEGPIKLRIIQANGNKQTWACESSGWTTNTNVIHISSNGISGDDLNPDEEVQVFVELL